MREWSSNTKIGEVFHPARLRLDRKESPGKGYKGGLTA